MNFKNICAILIKDSIPHILAQVLTNGVAVNVGDKISDLVARSHVRKLLRGYLRWVHSFEMALSFHNLDTDISGPYDLMLNKYFSS